MLDCAVDDFSSAFRSSIVKIKCNFAFDNAICVLLSINPMFPFDGFSFALQAVAIPLETTRLTRTHPFYKNTLGLTFRYGRLGSFDLPLKFFRGEIMRLNSIA